MNDKYQGQESGESCRLLPRTVAGFTAEASVIAGFPTGSYILVVRGKKPTLNMRVKLSPLYYPATPDYWGIQVIGCSSEIELPAVGDYCESLPLDDYRGKKGIEIVWADGEICRFKVPGE